MKWSAIIKKAGTEDWWDDLSDEQQNRVEEAMAQYKAGKSVTHEEIKKKLTAWRNR